MTDNRTHHPDTSAVARKVDELLHQKKLYSLGGAAEALSISRKHVYALVNRGELATVWIGRRRLIAASELDRYVEHLVAAESW